MSNSKKISVMNKPATWWQVAIFTCALQLLSGVLLWGIGRSASGNDKTKEELKLKADKTYVDHQDNMLRLDIQSVQTNVDKTIIRIDDNLKEIRSYILTKK